MKGYDLHDARLRFLGGIKSSQSFKFELASVNDNLLQKTIESIEHDSKCLFGDGLSAEEDITVLIFWLRALSLGAVFGYSAAELRNNVNILTGKDGVLDRVFNSITPAIKLQLDKQKWMLFVDKPKRGLADKSLERMQRDFFRILSDPENPKPEIQKLAKQYAEQIAEIPYNEHKQFIAGLFGIELLEDTSAQDDDRPDITLTFAFLPELEQKHKLTTLTEEIESVMRLRSDLLAQATGQTMDKKTLEHFIGVGSNGNALFTLLHGVANALITKEGQQLADYQTVILNNMDKIVGYTEKGCDDWALGQIQALTQAAKELGPPKFTKSWGDYRSLISGKIQSWHSNRERMKKELYTQLALLREDARKLHDDLKAIKDYPASLYANADLLLSLLGDEGTMPSDMKITGIQGLLPDLRREANIWYQEFIPELRTIKRVPSRKSYNIKKHLPSLTANLQRLPLFYGENATSRFAKFKDTKKLLRFYLTDMLEIGDLLESNLDKGYELEARDLEGLLEWHRKSRSSQARAAGSKIAMALNIKLRSMGPKEHYFIYRANHESGATTVETPSIQSRMLIDVWKVIWKWGEGLDVSHENLEALMEFNELWRRIIPLMIRFSPNDVDINKAKLSPASQAFLAALRDKNVAVIQRLTQNHIASEFKGLLNILSRKEFISRSTIQTQSGDQCTVLMNPDISRHHKFRVQVNTAIEFKPLITKKLVVVAKSTEKTRLEVKKFQPSKGPVFSIVTNINSKDAKHRIRYSQDWQQWLNWFIEKPQRKHCELKLSGSSLIVESTNKIDWSGEQPNVEIVSKRLFVSIPFTMLAPGQPIEYEFRRYIGFDMGEYYMAYSVIEPTGQQVKIIDQGLVPIYGLNALYETIQNQLNRQMRGTFSMPSSKLSRLYEAKSGDLRRKVHSLAIQHKAKIVHEGGDLDNYMDRIYLPIKRADTWPDLTNVTRAAHVQSWGKTKVQTGILVGAQGTSQRCSKCRRWFKPLIDFEQKEPYAIGESVPKFKDIKTASIGNQRFYLLSDSEDQTLKPTQLASAIRRFMHPALDGDVIKFLGINLPAAFKDENTRHAVFVCPFMDCTNVSHSDRQAAFNIALKGYIKDYTPKSEDKKLDYDAEMQRYEVVGNVAELASQGAQKAVKK